MLREMVRIKTAGFGHTNAAIFYIVETHVAVCAECILRHGSVAGLLLGHANAWSPGGPVPARAPADSGGSDEGKWALVAYSMNHHQGTPSSRRP